MTIKQIILSTVAFGFTACNILAMENNREKLMTKKPLDVFLVRQNGWLKYVDTQAPANLLRPSMLQHIPTRFRFGKKFEIEKALAEDNFVFCPFAYRREGVIFGTRDKERCNDALLLMNIKAVLKLMPDPERLDDKISGGY